MRRDSGWAFALMALLATTGAQPEATAQGAPAGSPRPRTDGVFYLIVDKDKDANGVPLCAAPRLYEGGTALGVEFRGAPLDLAKWFDLEKEDLFPGIWTLEGDNLTVVVSTGLAESRRVGKLGPRGWRAGDEVTYAFAPIVFARSQPLPAPTEGPTSSGTGRAR